MRYGSLCSGYGGLEAGVQAVLGGTTAWHVEYDTAPSKILAHHHPEIPNYGDLTTVDWTTVEPIQVMTAGYPCQPFSHAGKRAGTDDERHLWPHIADAVGVLRPQLCVFENVRGHLSLGFNEVLRDLDLLHYETQWVTVRAADAGAPHNRARLFIFGRDRGRQLRGRTGGRGGLHRDLPREDGGHVRDPRPGRHGHEAHLHPAADARAVLGADGHPTTGDGTEPREGDMGGGRPGGRRLPDGGSAASDPEAGGGAGRAALPRAAMREPGRAWPAPLDRGAEAAGGDRQAQGDGTQRPRTGAGQADAPKGDAGSDPALGCLVGAERRPLRTCGVRWPHSHVGNGDLGPYVRASGAPHGRFRVFVFAWPADPTGHARWLRDGDGRAVADTDSAGREARSGRPGTWDARRRESVVGGGANRGWDSTADTDVTGREGGEPAGRRDMPARGASADTSGQRHGRPAMGAGTGSVGRLDREAPATGDQRERAREVPRDRSPETPTDTERGGREARSPDDGAPCGAGSGATGSEPTPWLAPSSSANSDRGHSVAWGDYEPAIRRWEHLTRPAPPPTEPGRNGAARLSPAFVEWLMGLPAGHVTAVPGLSRNDQLKALGNGVVPQQAALATRIWAATMQGTYPTTTTQDGAALLPTPMTAYTSRTAEEWRAGRPAGNGATRQNVGDLRIVVEELLPDSTATGTDDGRLW